MTLADDLQVGVATAEREAAGDPAVMLAVRRAALTVAVHTQGPVTIPPGISGKPAGR